MTKSQIVIINFGTDERFSPFVGDKYYCKTLASAKKQLLSLTANEIDINNFTIDDYEQVKRYFLTWKDKVLNTFNAYDLQIDIKELQINLSIQDLI